MISAEGSIDPADEKQQVGKPACPKPLGEFDLDICPGRFNQTSMLCRVMHDAQSKCGYKDQIPSSIQLVCGCEQEVVRPKSSTPDTGACKTHDDVRSFLIGQISQSVTVDAIFATVLLSTPSAFRPSGSRMNIRHACESSRRSYAVHARSWFNISKRGTMHYDAHTLAAYTPHVVFDTLTLLSQSLLHDWLTCRCSFTHGVRSWHMVLQGQVLRYVWSTVLTTHMNSSSNLSDAIVEQL